MKYGYIALALAIFVMSLLYGIFFGVAIAKDVSMCGTQQEQQNRLLCEEIDRLRVQIRQLEQTDAVAGVKVRGCSVSTPQEKMEVIAMEVAEK